jgi:hypothetical protein
VTQPRASNAARPPVAHAAALRHEDVRSVRADDERQRRFGKAASRPLGMIQCRA